MNPPSVMAADYWTARFIVWTLMILHSAASSAPSADVSYFVGETVVLSCFTKLDDLVEWRFLGPTGHRETDMVRDGEVMNGWKTRGVLAEEVGTKEYRLVIPNVQTTDNGAYRCVEDAGLGDSHRYNLTVSEYDRNDSRATFWTSVGRPVVLPCLTSHDVPVDWEFRRSMHPHWKAEPVAVNGQMFERWSSKASIESVTTGDYSLIISNPLISDTGTYVCTEDAGIGQKHEYLFNVAGSNGAAAHVPAGTDVAFICLIQNAIRIRWLFNGTIFYNGYRVQEGYPRFGVYWNDVAKHSVLIIKSAFPSDAGTFTCLSASATATSQNFMLYVTGCPPSTQAVLSQNTAEVEPRHVQSVSIVVVAIAVVSTVILTTLLAISIALCRRRRRSNLTMDNESCFRRNRNRTRTDTRAEMRQLKPTASKNEPKADNSKLPDVAFESQVAQQLHKSILSSEGCLNTEEGPEVRGVCVIGDMLYVARDEQSDIDVYNRHTMLRVRRLLVTGEGRERPCCMTTEPTERSLFITYYMAKIIRRIRVDQDDDPLEWGVDFEPDGISATSAPGVVVTLRPADCLIEFDTNGRQLRSIHLTVRNPRFAIQFDAEHFVVCHGCGGGVECGMCLVSNGGAIVKVVDSNISHPLHATFGPDGRLFVADFNKNKIAIFDRNLDYLDDALPRDTHVNEVFRLCFDDEFERLYVGEFVAPRRVLSFRVDDSK